MRDSGNVNGIGDLTAPGKGDAPKFGHEMGDWEKRIFGIVMTEVRDAGFL